MPAKESCADCPSVKTCACADKPTTECVDPFAEANDCYAGFARCCRWNICELRPK